MICRDEHMEERIRTLQVIVYHHRPTLEHRVEKCTMHVINMVLIILACYVAGTMIHVFNTVRFPSVRDEL